MATRSTIGIQNEDNSIDLIYCHWDGYYSGVGKTLKEHYNTEEKVRQLIDRGNLSSLGKTIDESSFYSRDKIETREKAKKVNSKDQYKQLHEEFNYLWINDKWLCSERDYYNFIEFTGEKND